MRNYTSRSGKGAVWTVLAPKTTVAALRSAVIRAGGLEEGPGSFGDCDTACAGDTGSAAIGGHSAAFRGGDWHVGGCIAGVGGRCGGTGGGEHDEGQR